MSYTDLEQSECSTGDQILRTWTANVSGLPTCNQVCSQLISINDNTAPTLSDCPADIVVNTTADIVHWEEPVALDNCLRVILSSTYSPGSTFDVGTTSVVYTASDYCGNQSSCTFLVSVLYADENDCPSDVMTSADDNGVVSWETPTYSGSCESCTSSYKYGFSFLGSDGGSSYYISKKKYYFSDALEQAARYGGHLVSIGSQSENDYLSDRINEPVIIGLTDRNSEGAFMWSNGEDMTYSNWYLNQPNDYNNDQDYVVLLASGQWNDIGNEKGYVIMELQCEFVSQVSGPTNGTAVTPGIYTVSYSMSDGCGMNSACTYSVTVTGSMNSVSNDNTNLEQLASDESQANNDSLEFDLPSSEVRSDLHNFVIYPNPASEFVNIAFDQTEDRINRNISVVDKLGREVYSASTDNSLLRVDVSQSAFQSGYYFVIVQSGKEMKMERFIVVK